MFWKLLKFETFSIIRILFKNFQNIIKTILKLFSNLSKFVKIYNSLSILYCKEINDCDLRKIYYSLNNFWKTILKVFKKFLNLLNKF